MMELLYDKSAASLAAALVARYASPPAVQRAAAAASPRVIASFIGPLARSFLSPRLERLPLLLLDEGSTALEEPAAIIRYCAAAGTSGVSSVGGTAASASDPTTCSGGSSSSTAAPVGAPAGTAELLLGGASPMQQAQVMQWLAFCGEHQFILRGASTLQELQQHLASRTFFAAPHVTVADLTLYAACHGWMATASEKERLLHCNVTRWFDHVQHLPGVAGAVEQLPLLDVIPAPRAQPPPPAAAARVSPGSRSSSEKALLPNGDIRSEAQQQQQRRQEAAVLSNGLPAGDMKKREKGKGKTKDAAAAKAEAAAAGRKKEGHQAERPVEDVTRLRVVVGQIKKVWRHPDADQLFCEEVDVGEGEPRLIASGLVPYTTAEQLEGQKVLVMANMKPRQLRGFHSHGMLLCATSSDRTRCEILTPPPDTPVGEVVTWEGVEAAGPPDMPHMNTKEGKYPFAAVQPHFRTDENCVGYYKEHRFMTSRGPVRCETIAGGTIS